MFLYLALFYLLVAPTRAFWILSHGSLTQDRLDPLVTPGEVATHVHNIIGSSAFGPNITFEALRADNNCTTAPVQADMSNYWAPQFYCHDHTNNTLVPISFVNTYYLQCPSSNQTEIKGFPADFRMLSGSAVRSAYNASNQADRAVNFVCLNYSGNTTTTNELPDVACPDGLRAQIVFPSCWDGTNVDSEDHKSHVAYPVGENPDNGDCLDSQPVKLITLFHEWIFDTGKFEFVSGVKNFVFSTGDETGYTFHADFVNGWDTDVLQAAVDQCTGSLFGDLEQCPPFVASLDKKKADACKIARRVEEDIDGPLTALRGCNPVPSNATVAKCDGLATPAIKGLTDVSDANGNNTSSSASSNPTTLPTSAVATTSSSPSNLRMNKRHYPKQPLHRAS